MEHASTHRFPFSLSVSASFPAQAGLLALLIAELLALSLAFDTQSLDTVPSVWGHLLNWAPQYLRAGITIVLVTLLFSGRDLWHEAKAGSAFEFGGRRVALTLGVHAAALAAFTYLTSRIVAGHFATFHHPAVWTFAWFGTGAATLIAWALAFMPAAGWLTAFAVARLGLLWGTGVGLAVWASGFVTGELWVPLARWTFAVVDRVLGLMYHQTVSDAARLVIGTPAFKVRISPECSGYEGIGLILAFLSVYLAIARHELRFPGALLLLPIGAVTIWVVNAFRIVALIAIGTAGWRDIALGGFHSQAGWIAFNAVALGMVALTMHRGYFRRHAVATTRTPPPDHDPTAAYLAPFVAITAMAMLTGAFTAGFDWFYPLRVFAALAVLWMFRRTYLPLKWTFSWQAMAIGAVTFVVWIALLPAPSTSATWQATLASVPTPWAAAWLAIRLIGYVVTVPIAEELAFRGFLPRRLASVDFHKLPIGAFSWSAFLVSSAVFGAFHGRFWFAGIVAGMAFAVALYRRGALGDAVLAHATTNGLIALYAFTTGHWSMLS
jgi:exosortase E/protease (VPEID-CTERM system)